MGFDIDVERQKIRKIKDMDQRIVSVSLTWSEMRNFLLLLCILACQTSTVMLQNSTTTPTTATTAATYCLGHINLNKIRYKKQLIAIVETVFFGDMKIIVVSTQLQKNTMVVKQRPTFLGEKPEFNLAQIAYLTDFVALSRMASPVRNLEFCQLY